MELQRIARVLPIEYNTSKVNSITQAKADAEAVFIELNWNKAYDFCERLHNHLARDVGYTWNDESQITTPKVEVQAFIAEEIHRLFEEEGIAFEFSDGLVRRRGRKHTVDVTTMAQFVLDDPRLTGARRHCDKALQFFCNPSKPDFENSVKEAVCAVEAAARSDCHNLHGALWPHHNGR